MSGTEVIDAGAVSAASFDEQLLARVRAAAHRWSASTSVSSLDAVTKGSSSLTYVAVLADTDGSITASPKPAGIDHNVTAYVKVAPPNLAPVRNRDVLRQAAVLELLYREGSVPVPKLLFQDPGAPPEVPPFFVTESAEGTCIEPLVDDVALPTAEELTARTVDAAQTLAKLHRVDPTPLRAREGDASGERAELHLEVQRWARIFATVEGGISAQAEVCAQRLLANVPTPMTPVIVHGDFRLGNAVCSASRVRAVLDWEIWSLTDPRIDVAWLLMTLSAQGLPSAVRATAPGLPSPEEVLRVYEQASGSELADLAWFAALSRFRAAAAMSLNIKHNRRRPNPSPRIEAYADRLPEFLELATSLLD